MMRRKRDRQGLAVLAWLYEKHGEDAILDVRVGEHRYLLPATELRTCYDYYRQMKLEASAREDVEHVDETWRGRALMNVTPVGEG